MRGKRFLAVLCAIAMFLMSIGSDVSWLAHTAAAEDDVVETSEKPAEEESEPETKSETKEESKPETKPETKEESKPETKPETKEEPEPETKPETKEEPEPESESKPEAEEPAKETSEKPAAEEPAQETSEKPAAEEPAKETSEEPAAEEPAQETPEKPAAEEPAAEPAEEPAAAEEPEAEPETADESEQAADEAPVETPEEPLEETPEEEQEEEPLTLSALTVDKPEASLGDKITITFETSGAESVSWSVARNDGAYAASGEAPDGAFTWKPEATGIYIAAVTATRGDEAIIENVRVIVRDGKLRVSADADVRYGVVGEQELVYKLSAAGGVEPYAVEIEINANGKTVYSSDEYTDTVKYMPDAFGEHTLSLTVTDAEGRKAEAESAAVPVATREENEALPLPTLRGDMTFADKLIAVAKSQLGYTESDRNFIIDDAGKLQGWTVYGAWAGAPYEEWCAMFLSWCLDKAGIPESAMPRSSGCQNWKEKLGSRYIDDEDSYIPEAGDIVFFHHDREGSSKDPNYPNHIGVVISASDSGITTVEGNSGKAVSRRSYSLGDGAIVGYASMRAVMEQHDPNYVAPVTYPAAQLTATVDGVTFTVDAPEGALPEGVELVIGDCDVRDAARKVLVAMDYGNIADSLDEVEDLTAFGAAWRIGFQRNGEAVEPLEAVYTTISDLKVDKTSLGGNAYVLWTVDEAADEAEITAEGEAFLGFNQSAGGLYAVTGSKPGAAIGRPVMKAMAASSHVKSGYTLIDNTTIDTASYITVEAPVAAADGKAIEDGTYSGVVTTAIPAKAVFGWADGHMTDSIAGVVLQNFYPHGDGKKQIGGVLFEFSFPSGVTYDYDHITVDKGTTAFSMYELKKGTYSITNNATSSGCGGTTYTNKLSYNTSANAVTVRFTFTDSNFEGIFAAYKSNPDALIKISVPYTMKITEGQSLAAIGQIKAEGQTWMHITSGLNPAYIYTNVFSGDAAQAAYKATYKFEYTDDSYDAIPERVTEQLPEDGLIPGGVYTPPTVKNVNDEETGIMWTFLGWDPASSQDADADFVGTWDVGQPAYRAVYQFVDAVDETADLPPALTALLPSDSEEDATGETVYHKYDTVDELKAVNPLSIEGEGVTVDEATGVITWNEDENGLIYWQTKGFTEAPVVDVDNLTVTYTAKWYPSDLSTGYWHLNDDPVKPYKGVNIATDIGFWDEFTNAVNGMTASDTMYINGALPEGSQIVVKKGTLVAESDVTMIGKSAASTTGIDLSSGTVLRCENGAKLTITKYALGLSLSSARVEDGNYILDGNGAAFNSSNGTFQGTARENLTVSAKSCTAAATAIKFNTYEKRYDASGRDNRAGVKFVKCSVQSTNTASRLLYFNAFDANDAELVLENYYMMAYSGGYMNLTDSHFVLDGKNASQTLIAFSYCGNNTSTWSNSQVEIKNTKKICVTSTLKNLVINNGSYVQFTGTPVGVNVRHNAGYFPTMTIENATIYSNATSLVIGARYETETGTKMGAKLVIGDNAVFDTPATANAHNNGSDVYTTNLDDGGYFVTGGSHLIRYAPNYSSSYGKTTPRSGYIASTSDFLSYFKLADASLTSLTVEYEDGVVREYPVSRASSDGNKYVWTPASEVTIHAIDADGQVTDAAFGNGKTATGAYATIRGMSINDVVRYNSTTDNRAAFTQADIAGLKAKGKFVAGWVYKVDGGEAQTLIETGETAVSESAAFEAITALKTSGKKVDIYPVYADNPAYRVEYAFASAPEGYELPKTIVDALPEGVDYTDGNTVAIAYPELDKLDDGTYSVVDADNDGVWTWDGSYTGAAEDGATVTEDMIGETVTLTATWTLALNPHIVKYEFVSDREDKALPEDLADRTTLPGETTVYGNTPFTPDAPAEFSVADGKWTFTGYDVTAPIVLTEAETTLTGRWHFAGNDVTISYAFEAKDGSVLPEAVKALQPEPEQAETGIEKNLTQPANSSVVVYEGEVPVVTWVFEGYLVDGEAVTAITPTTAAITVTGVWHAEPYIFAVKYEFAKADENGPALDDEVSKLLPAEAEANYGDAIVPAVPEAESVAAELGVWSFQGWKVRGEDGALRDADANGEAVGTSGLTFVGVWEFTYNTHAVSYSFVSADEALALPTEISDLLPAEVSLTAVDGAVSTENIVDRKFNDGSLLKPATPDPACLAVEGGIWSFSGYDVDELRLVGEDHEFVGTWKFFTEEEVLIEITFVNSDGDEVTMQVVPGEPLPANPFPPMANYVFLGWSVVPVPVINSGDPEFEFIDKDTLETSRLGEITYDEQKASLLDLFFATAYAEENTLVGHGTLYAVWRAPAVVNPDYTVDNVPLSGDIAARTPNTNGVFNTGHSAILMARSGGKFDMAASLNVAKIKDQMDEVLDNMNTRYGEELDTEAIWLSGMTSTFTVKIKADSNVELPADRNSYKLCGLKGTNYEDNNTSPFAITDVVKNGDTVSVTMELQNPDGIETFQDLYKAIHDDTNDVLTMTVTGASVKSSLTTGFVTVIGSVTGEMSAIATKAKRSGDGYTTMTFAFDWKSEQDDHVNNDIGDGTDLFARLDGNREIRLTLFVEPNLYGDLLVDDNTENSNVYGVKSGQTVDLAATLDVRNIQAEMQAIEDKFEGVNLGGIGLDGLTCEFEATLNVPDGLDFSGVKDIELVPDNIFKVKSASSDGNVLTVKMGLIKKYDTYTDLKKAVCEDTPKELRLNVPGVKVDEDACGLITMTGTVNGSFGSDATSAHDNTIDFAFTWNATQDHNIGQENEDGDGTDFVMVRAGDKETIALSLFVEPKLYGDLRVGEDTEHDDVIYVDADSDFDLIATLDVRSIKKEMVDVEKIYQGSVPLESIALSGLGCRFVAELTIPEGLDFSKITSYELTTGVFTVVEPVVSGNKLTVEMVLNSSRYPTYLELKKAIVSDTMPDELTLTLEGVHVKREAVGLQTMVGTLTGEFGSDATSGSGTTRLFGFEWGAEQDRNIGLDNKGGEGSDFILGGNEGALIWLTLAVNKKIDVTKVWSDADDQDGKRPDSVTFILTENGEDVKDAAGEPISLTLTADDADEADANKWTGTLTGLKALRVSNDGTTTSRSYDVREALPEGWTEADGRWTKAGDADSTYTAVKTGSEAEGFTITNSHTPVTRSITIEKVWDDNDNQDGLRTAVQLVLTGTANGRTLVNETFDIAADAAGDALKKTYPGLPAYNAGTEIAYAVDEATVPTGYTKSVDDFTVTNRHTPATRSITVEKVWDDSDNQDGLRTAVQLVLTGTAANGETVVKETFDIAANAAGDALKKTYTGLPVNSAGKAITYTVDEATVPTGYTKTVDGFTVTNRHTPATRSITIEKVWADSDNQDGLRTAVQLVLTGTAANGETVVKETFDIAADAKGDALKKTYTGLPVNSAGAAITYAVDEATVPTNYTKTVAGFTVTNTQQLLPADDDPPVKKILTGDKPEKDEEFTFQLKAISNTLGLAIGDMPMPAGASNGTVTVKAKADETKEFGVITFDQAGRYMYEITEVDTGVDNYSYDETLYTVIYDVAQEGYHLNAVRTVLKDGRAAETATFEFTNVYTKPTVPARSVRPTVSATPTPTPSPSPTPASVTVNTTPTPVPITYVQINGQKHWEDDDDSEGKRPGSITVELLRDGEPVITRTVTEAGGWKYNFGDVPENDEKGNAYTYTVREHSVTGYFARTDGYDLTNKLLPSFVPAGTPTDETEPGENGDNTETDGKTLVPVTAEQAKELAVRKTSTPPPKFAAMRQENLEDLIRLFDYNTHLWGSLMPTGDTTPIYPYVFGGIGLLALVLVMVLRKRRS